MTKYERVKEKADAACKAWVNSGKIGIRSTFFWLRYKHWKNVLDNLPLAEAENEIGKEKNDG